MQSRLHRSEERRSTKGQSISIVVCTRGRPDGLVRCLEAIGRQPYRNRETVIVDNGGDARVEAVARSYNARYAVETRPGIRFARNRGINEACGEIVAFTDDDCEPERPWLETIAREFEAEKDLGCCTGPILPVELETRSQRLLERRGGYTRGSERHEHSERTEPNEPGGLVQAWRYGSGGNMAFRRSALERAGGFDERSTGAEDLEMFFRVQRLGYTLAYVPDASVWHRHVRDRRSLWKRLYGWGKGYIAFLVKVALEDEQYAHAAELEIANWFRYQLRERSRDVLGRRYPPDLYAAELIGGTLGALGGPVRLLRSDAKAGPRKS